MPCINDSFKRCASFFVFLFYVLVKEKMHSSEHIFFVVIKRASYFSAVHQSYLCMITRIWHGKTKASDADIYLDYIRQTGLADYRYVKGNLSAKIWRRTEGDVCHFYTVTEWDSIESIKQFAGEDYQKARYYEGDKKYLLAFEETVTHYETFYG